MSASRFQNRDRLYRKLVEASPIGQLGSGYQKDSLVRSLDNAHRLLSSPAAKAFDLTLEKPGPLPACLQAGISAGGSMPAFTRDGNFVANIQWFGLGCLLARRLVEAGARYIEVTTEYIPFLNWNTHETAMRNW